VNAATALLQHLSERGSWGVAVQEALLGAAAAGSPVSAAQVAQLALEGMGAAQRGMSEVVEGLLVWMQCLHEEMIALQGWLESPKDLLGVSDVGCGG
jgi:hypothetical protein